MSRSSQSKHDKKRIRLQRAKEFRDAYEVAKKGQKTEVDSAQDDNKTELQLAAQFLLNDSCSQKEVKKLTGMNLAKLNFVARGASYIRSVESETIIEVAATLRKRHEVKTAAEVNNGGKLPANNKKTLG